MAYVRRADGTFAIPTDALGIAPMMAGGVGIKNGTVFWDQIFMSQISHAMCMKSEAEMYRRLESDCDRDDGGCTGGSLFWVSGSDFTPIAPLLETRGPVLSPALGLFPACSNTPLIPPPSRWQTTSGCAVLVSASLTALCTLLIIYLLLPLTVPCGV